MRDEQNLVPLSMCPLPAVDEFAQRGGRFGAHNLHENRPAPGAWVSEQVVVGTFFNGGVRAFDLSNPFRPEE
ncbi:MAG: LVIVD repeat-containing protein, partial [bacterium]